ncbi:MAG: FAD-dependent oxidoreductase [Trebonia sp.]
MQEHVYDVIVLGTGAAGLTAALRAAASGARVGLFEKADTVGGTSAWSGGTVWLPNNRHEAGNRKAGRWSAPCSRSPTSATGRTGSPSDGRSTARSP